MSTIRAEFREITGLDKFEDSSPRCLSDAIRRLWVMVADTYDARALYPLFRYHLEQMSKYQESIGRPTPVVRAWFNLLIQLSAFTGHMPTNELARQLAPAVASVREPSWGCLQEAIEALAAAWEEIGL